MKFEGMKSPINVDVLRSSHALKIAVFFFIAITFFYFGKHWSDGYQQLVFFTQGSDPDPNPNQFVSTSPNYNKFFNLSAMVAQNRTEPPPEKTLASPPPPPPAGDSVEKFGIVNENGTMSEEFEVGDFDLEDWVNETQVVEREGGGGSSESVVPKFAIKKFGLCPRSMSEYIPCLDNVDAIRRLPSTEKGERFERHCPEQGRGLNCLVPAPKGYRTPIPWPKSRDEVKTLPLLFFLPIKPNGYSQFQFGGFWMCLYKNL